MTEFIEPLTAGADAIVLVAAIVAGAARGAMRG
jgi:hypothetical protein